MSENERKEGEADTAGTDEGRPISNRLLGLERLNQALSKISSEYPTAIIVVSFSVSYIDPNGWVWNPDTPEERRESTQVRCSGWPDVVLRPTPP